MRGGGVGGGEIVEVEGGHIVKSTGKKDRHSKVCTAKGPRDRRVRLSANTAIQFYDVQHRLGYDRPSKAVDWLIQKAKPAIDELAQLPPWNPTTTNNNNHNNTNVHYNQQTENPTCLVGINDNQEDNIGGGGGGNGLFYPHNNNNNIGWFDGMVTWNDGVTDTDNNNNNNSSANDDGGFMFNNNNNNPFGQSQCLYYQGGPLQSSNNNPSIRAWIDAAPSSMLAADHYLLPATMHQSVPGIGFASGGFSGFRVPPRIQGQEEEHGGVSNKPSSVSRY